MCHLQNLSSVLLLSMHSRHALMVARDRSLSIGRRSPTVMAVGSTGPLVDQDCCQLVCQRLTGRNTVTIAFCVYDLPHVQGEWKGQFIACLDLRQLLQKRKQSMRRLQHPQIFGWAHQRLRGSAHRLLCAVICQTTVRENSRLQHYLHAWLNAQMAFVTSCILK